MRKTALFVLFASAFVLAQIDTSKLKVPAGFRLSIFADTEGDPRLMAWSPGGVMLATITGEGSVVALPDPGHDGHADRVVKVLSDLNGPHGIAFHNGKLYVAEISRVTRYDWDEKNLRATNPQVIVRLPGSGGGHMTRTILFANGKLYVSAGSSCNVCKEDDPHRAAVMEYNEDGTGERIFARGLRNAVGLAFNPKTGTVWTTENSRDWLGDDLPPDEINDLGKNGGDFGWPYCYSDRVPDLKFSRNAAERCKDTLPPEVALQAHSAPLGLGFYTGKQFPAEYAGDLFVAFHGSWNRSVPTGYKVVRIRLNGEKPQVEDFVTGWLPPGATKASRWLGRPVGILVGPDGSLYVSDDANGAIYRITYGK